MVDSSLQYNSVLTTEHFMFYEMRVTAKLLLEEPDEAAVVNRIINDNLFQYPTERSLKRVSKACIRRLRSMGDVQLIEAIAQQPVSVSKQICLYAMMCQSKLVREFMITVIGEKYRQRDSSFGKIDLNGYFIRLQEQNDIVASWSDTTIEKLRQVLAKTLVENEYLDSISATHLNPVYLYPILENAIKEKGDLLVLPAFNCFS